MTQKLGTTPTQAYGKPSVAKFDTAGSYNQFDRVEWQGAVYGCKQDGTKGSVDEPLGEPQDHPETWELLYGYRFTGDGVTSTTSDHIEIAGGGSAKVDTDTGLTVADDGTIANTTTYANVGTTGAFKRCGSVTIARGLSGLTTTTVGDGSGTDYVVLTTTSDPILDAYSTKGITQERRAKLVPTDATSGQMTITGMPCTSGFGPMPSVVVLTVTDTIGLNTGDGFVYVETNMYSGDRYTEWNYKAMDAVLLNTTSGGVTTFTMGFMMDRTATNRPITGYLASSASVTIEAGTYLLFLS